MSIAVDHREKGKDEFGHTATSADTLVKMLTGLNVPAHKTTLDVGDMMFHDSAKELVLVTRKAADLYDSLHTGHLQDELERIVNAIKSYGGGKAFWIIEGQWSRSSVREGHGIAHFQRSGDWFRKHREHGDIYGSFPGMVISAQTAGFSVIPTGDTYETAVALATLYRRAQEGWPSRIAQRLTRPKLKWTGDSRVANLRGLWPGLREDTAVKLLREYGTIRAILKVALSDPKKFKVEGLGKKGIDNLMEVLK